MEDILPKPTGNACGGCTVCCTVLRVEDTPGAPKAGYTPCQWLHKGDYQGCSIHKDKPPTCRSFECHYIKLVRRPDLTTSANLRPDKSGVMLMHNVENRLFFTAHVVSEDRDAWKAKEVMEVIDQLLSEGFKVIISWGPEPKKLLVERGERGSKLYTDIEIIPEPEKAVLDE